MQEPRVLVLYGTSHGHTAKIAARIAEVLLACGMDARLQRADDVPAEFRIDDFDAVVVGASLVIHRYQKSVTRFIRARRDELRERPSAFFAVSGSAGSPDPAHRDEARAIMDAYLAGNEWWPDLTASFGGAIAYTKYNPLLRWWMKRISKSEGGSTDTSRDHELTDWDDVERFGRDFADLVDADRGSSAAQDASRSTLSTASP